MVVIASTRISVMDAIAGPGAYQVSTMIIEFPVTGALVQVSPTDSQPVQHVFERRHFG